MVMMMIDVWSWTARTLGSLFWIPLETWLYRPCPNDPTKVSKDLQIQKLILNWNRLEGQIYETYYK